MGRKMLSFGCQPLVVLLHIGFTLLSLTFFWYTFVKFSGIELEFDRD